MGQKIIVGFKKGNYKGTSVRPEVSIRSRYLWFFKFAYCRRAKRKGLEVTLTDDEFINLVTTNCHYCNRPWDSDTRRVNGSLVKMGTIDRKDASKGYTTENCVPSCKQCNTTKMDYGYDEFKAHIIRLYDHFASK